MRGGAEEVVQSQGAGHPGVHPSHGDILETQVISESLTQPRLFVMRTAADLFSSLGWGPI